MLFTDYELIQTVKNYSKLQESKKVIIIHDDSLEELERRIGSINNDFYSAQFCSLQTYFGNRNWKEIELKVSLIEPDCVYILILRSSNRIDSVVDFLLNNNVDIGSIYTELSEKRQVLKVSEIFNLQHFDVDDYNFNYKNFSRYALIIRCMFVADFFEDKKNAFCDDAKTLYGNYIEVKNYNFKDVRIKNFIELILSVEMYGFKNLWINIDSCGRILDGSHRMSILMYLHKIEVPVRISHTCNKLISNYDWLINNFADKDISNILAAYEYYGRKYNK